MPNNIIKTLKTQDLNTTFRIGADAQDIDYNNEKNLYEVIGEQLTENSLSNRIETNEDNINTLTDITNQLTTEISNILSNNENISIQLENLENNYQTLNNNIQSITLPTLVSQIIWDVAGNKNLRTILGALENMAYSSVRDWLESLENKTANLTQVNTWNSIADELDQSNEED